MQGNKDMGAMLLYRTSKDEVSGMLDFGITAGVSTAAEVHKLFGYALPEAMCTEIAEEFKKSKLAAFGDTFACSAYHAPRTVILGDAAHAVTPTLGQGCNSAVCYLTFLACSSFVCKLQVVMCYLDVAEDKPAW
jgi:2-polyprenyl-6-methoxyphenol hydroxylase-like FAD-dependent oxidoreductase